MNDEVKKRGRKPAEDTDTTGETTPKVNDEPVFKTKRYTKYTLEVETVQRGSAVIGFNGRFVEVLNKKGLTNNCVCSEIQAKRLNNNWHTSKMYLIPSNEEMPSEVRRRFDDDRNNVDTITY